MVLLPPLKNFAAYLLTVSDPAAYQVVICKMVQPAM